MRYYREIRFPGSHFNGAEQYEQLRSAIKNETMQHDWRKIFTETHGHDFKVEVTLMGEGGENGFIMTDESIEAVVIGNYANKNLSLLDRFGGQRASTELMARAMAEDIAAVAPTATVVHVRVWEDGARWAEFTRRA